MVTAILPLSIKGAVVARRGKRLLGPVDAVLSGGGLTAVIGPNGSGKTTLLRLMHGLERAREGRLNWAAGRDAARDAQAFVFQSPIMMRRSVVDCIAYPLRLTGVAQAKARDQAAQAAIAVGLADALDRPAQALSGGEKQKLALARALIRKPQVLFLDEPTASLDGRATREVEDILTTARKDGARLIMATHDMGQARRLADEVWFLLHGRLQWSGPADAFFAEPPTKEAQAFLEGRIVE